MKVYVSEMPKGCLTCPYIVDKGDYDLCAIKDYVIDDAFKYVDKRKKSCPLLSLSNYTKQVRKEVVEFIDKCFEIQKYESIWINPDKTEFSCDVSYAYEWWESFRKILLDQIQGEIK